MNFPSPLEIPELTEKIISFLIYDAKDILNLCVASKRLNILIYSKSTWKSFGFSDNISPTNLLSPLALKSLLCGMRRIRIKEIYKREKEILQNNVSDIQDRCQKDQKASYLRDILLYDSLENYFSLRGVTSEAYLALQKVLSITVENPGHSIITTTDFVEMALIPRQVLTRNSMERSAHCCQGTVFGALGDNSDEYKDLVSARTIFEPIIEYEMFIRFVEKDQRTFILLKRNVCEDNWVFKIINQFVAFVIINFTTNEIESCGDLNFVLKTNAFGWKKDANEPEISDAGQYYRYMMAKFLSLEVFKLEKTDPNLVDKEFNKKSVVQIEEKYYSDIENYKLSSYFAQNIPLGTKKD